MSDMRTSLSRVRGLGAARKGTHDFWHQRLTALANVPLGIFALVFMVRHSDAPYAVLAAALAQPFTGAAFLLLILSMCWHMRLGLQVVIEDYIIARGFKIAALILNQFFAMTLAVVSTLAILKLMLGA